MDKTEMMKRYEAETGKDRPAVNIYSLIDWYEAFSAWLESKAADYDRLMSCGLSMKELANILGHPVAMENDDDQNTLYYFNSTPHIGQFSDGTQFWSCKRKWRLPRQLVNFSGDWEDSLAFPDGWREK